VALAALAASLRIDPLQLEPIIELLAEIDWVAHLDEGGASRLVLLCEPSATTLKPLVDRTLLAPGSASAPLRERLRLDAQTLAQALAR
jgi:membrane protein